MSQQGPTDTEREPRRPSIFPPSLEPFPSALAAPPIANKYELTGKPGASLGVSEKGASFVATEKSTDTRSTNIETRRTPDSTRRRYGSGTASTSAAFAGPVAERVVLGVLEKVKTMLPVYSGLTLNDLAQDATLRTALQLLCFLAAPSRSPPSSNHASMSSVCPSRDTMSILNADPPPSRTLGGTNIAARGLCELLERVSKLQASPVQILHSQVFLLHWILCCLSSRFPEPAAPKLESELDVFEARDPNPNILPTSGRPLPSIPKSKRYPGALSSHNTAYSLQKFPRDGHSSSTPVPTNISKTDDTKINIAVDAQTLQSIPDPRTSSVSITPLDPAVTSYVLSVLLTLIPCFTGDVVGYSNAGATSDPHHSTPLHPPSSHLHTRLTPIPPVPLHGFEAFAPPSLHADGAGVLCPGVVWEVGTNTQLVQSDPHRPRSSNTKTSSVAGIAANPSSGPDSHPRPGKEICAPPYTALHIFMDTYPATLCFLPPSMLLARYAARCVYFISKNGRDRVVNERFNRVMETEEPERGGEPDASEIVWNRILWGMRRLAGTLDMDGSGGLLNAQYEEGMIDQDWEPQSVEQEKEQDKGRGKEKVRLKDKGSASPKRRQRDLSTKFHRRRTVPVLSVSGIQGLNGCEPGQSWDGRDMKEDRNRNSRLRGGLEWEGDEDVVELRMLGFVAMRKERLCVIVRQLASCLVNMSIPAQGTAAAAIRTGIFAWLEDAPEEFIRIAGWKPINSPRTIEIIHGMPTGKVETSRSQNTKHHQAVQRIEGAEGLLDIIFVLAMDYISVNPGRDHGHSESSVGSIEGVAGKQLAAVRALLWTAAGALFCVCPERVHRAKEGSSSNLLTQLASFTHAPGPNVDIALRVYADICRVAFFIPPCGWKGEGDKVGLNGEVGQDRCEGTEGQRWKMDVCPLRAVADDVVNELASLLERYPPYTAQVIDTDLYTDALVAIYRFSPQRATPFISAWLLPMCGEAVKLCVVRAALTLVAEAGGFPWQPGLDLFVKACSRRMNGLLRTLLCDADEGASPLPRSLSPSHQDGKTLRRTLLLTLQGLLRLDLEFVLRGPSSADLAETNRAGVHVLTPPRDHGVLMMSLSMYGSWISESRRMYQKGARMLEEGAFASGGEPPLYSEAGEYLRTSVLTTLFACAQSIVHMWCSTENLLCLHAVRYILEIMAENAQNGEDMSWKYSEARFPALAMAEIALITAYKSSHVDISSTAIKCISLFAQIIQDPQCPPPPYMARDQYPAWRHFLAAATAVRVATLRHGPAAMQKHVRNELTSTEFPCGAHLAGWRECHWRYSNLSPIVSAPEGTVEPAPGLEIAPVTYKDRQAEWANFVLALARSSGICQDNVDSAFFDVLGPHLPDRMPLHHEPRKLVYEFVAQLIEKLAADTLHVRETIKQALGAELHLNAVPIFFEQLNIGVADLLKDAVGSVASTPESKVVLFVKNCISALSLLVNRLHGSTTLAVCEVGPILRRFAQFLNRPLTAASDLRTRAQFCGIVNFFVQRRETFTFHEDRSILQVLLDNIINWTTDIPMTTMSSDDQSTPEYYHSLRGCQVVALRTACELAKGLKLELLKTTNLDKRNEVSRIFHRYMMSFVKCLDLETAEDGASIKPDPIHTAPSIPTPSTNEAYTHEYVVDGIAHLVDANTDIGFKQCIGFGFDDDPRLRAVFMEVFSRVLKRGTRFDTRDTLKLGPKDGRLCELVRSSEILIDAIVTVCATSEIDSMIPVLLNIFDTRQTMLALTQRLVVREIKQAASPTELFRENTLINRLLSALVNQHGYYYLRTTLKPLVEETLRMVEEATLEMDPSKLQPGDDINANSRHVSQLAQFFIDRIIASAPTLPSLVLSPPSRIKTYFGDRVSLRDRIVIDICHYISTTVIKFWPESRHTAVGGFLFLRFFCPAIVAPDSIDLELSCQGVHTQNKMRRGLVIMAKILQNLSNNLMFGKEAHMMFLNPLLESNIGPMTKFLEKPFTTPSAEHMVDQWLGMTYDDADLMILHRFIQGHHDGIGRILLSAPGPSGSDPAPPVGASDIWAQLCTILVDLGPGIEPIKPTVAPVAANFKFQQFMSENAHLDRDPVRSILYACEDRPEIFVLRLQRLNVEIVDLHLLMYHLCYLLQAFLSSPMDCNFVLDYTSYASTAELPVDWLKYCIEFLPADIRLKVQALYALNTNALSQRFLRKLFLVSSEAALAREFHVVASVSELFEHVGHVESIAKNSTGLLETEAVHASEHVYQRYVHRNRSAVTLEVRESHLRITSFKLQEISPRLSGRTVEIVPLDEVDDVYRIASETDGNLNEFVIARYRHGTAMQFSSRNRNAFIQAIRAAKSSADSSDLSTIHRFSGLSDITVTLLIIGLINTCHEQEWPREAANVLLSAVCSYQKYDSIHSILPAKSASFIMHSSAAHALFSERAAALAPHLTLDFIIELRLGLNNAPINLKMTCLSYLPPWIRNLPRFATPGNALYDVSGSKLRDAIRSLCDLTFKDLNLYPLVKESIWVELSKMGNPTLSCVTDELMRLAVDSGVESRPCGLVADVVMTLSSIHVRSRIMSRLRQALRKKTLAVTSNIDDTAWSEMACLLRLAWAASYNPRDPTQNQLFISETAHVVTMVAAAGPLHMRLSVHGLVMNILHVLSTQRNPDDPGTAEFNAIVADASSPSTTHLFGLSLSSSTKTYTLAKDSSQHPDISAVEEISKMLLRVIEIGAGTSGLANVLKARWMSLVTATVFQAFSYMQARAFTVLGILMGDHLDSEFFYQILVALKNAITKSPEGNCVAVLSMLRCMCKIIPGLTDNSPYLCGVFWFAVALLQTGHLPYYVESMHLIRIVLTKLRGRPASANSVISMLLQARSLFGPELTIFDKLSGFSFTDELSFSLSITFLLYSVTQHQTLRETAGDVIRGILRIVAGGAQVGSAARVRTRYVDPMLVGFFLGSLPFCTTVELLRGLLEDANVDVAFWESQGMFSGVGHEGYECAVPFSLLGATDARSAHLTISFVVAMIELYVGDVSEREILYSLLMDANDDHPSLVSEAQSHYLSFSRTDWIDERIRYAFGGHKRATILTAMIKVFNSILTFADQSNLVPVPTTPADSTLSHEESGTPHYVALREWGMAGLTTHLRSHHKDNKNFALFSGPLERLLDRIME